MGRFPFILGRSLRGIKQLFSNKCSLQIYEAASPVYGAGFLGGKPKRVRKIPTPKKHK
jgi:hypothetical protein